MWFPAFWGLTWVQKSVFFIQENVGFIQVPIYQLHNLQAMKKLTFKREQILCKRQKKCVKNWLKYIVCITKA